MFCINLRENLVTLSRSLSSMWTHRSVVVVALGLAGIGNGLPDNAWNAWTGSPIQSNEILSLLLNCHTNSTVIARPYSNSHDSIARV